MSTATTPAPWATVDPALINPRAVRLVDAFKNALVRLRDEEGLTFADVQTAATLLQQLQESSGAPLWLSALPLFSETFRGGGDGYTLSEDLDSPMYIPDAPLIDNPGRLPMRPDEPGTPLIASGRVLDGHGQPLAGAELSIYHASNDGIYSGFDDNSQPRFNLRARQITDAEGRYSFTTITPVPYTNDAITGFAQAAAALGRTLYRPAHIHYEIHNHPDLLTAYRGETYFTGDPAIPHDFVGPKIASPSLQADTVLHDDPDDIAAHGFTKPFNTATFDFIVKTRTSPDIAVTAAPGLVTKTG